MNKIKWGFSGLSHDAALSVFKDNKLIFASHSERYSRVKNDAFLHEDLITEALTYGYPEVVYFYENPILKKTRQLYSGQYSELFSQSPKSYLKSLGLDVKVKYTSHHKSHASAGYFTSGYKDAVILCLDSIGEWETFTIWEGKNNKLSKKYSQKYPHSVGLWYSAMTQRLELKPQEHEYILMGMAALGDPNKYYKDIKQDFFKKLPTTESPSIKFKNNLHKGCKNWRSDLTTEQDYFDIAAATQKIYEEIFENILIYMKSKYSSSHLILMGGCTLNCVANTLAFKHYKNIWIMPNPGDAGSSIGCVLAHTHNHLNFHSPYLGHEIKSSFNTDQIINTLLKDKITIISHGKAEFGPRALGNRSLIADPRGPKVKDRVNAIKKREPFRPFAPMILEEYVEDYFEVPPGFKSPYMQFAVKCKYPKKFPAIIHVDESSRVQTVSKKDNPKLYELMKVWYDKTGCPILLNTSLNIKGEPLVNTKEDTIRWINKYLKK